MADDVANALTVDVEDYFHPSELAQFCPIDAWDSLSSRVEQNTRKTLELFARHGARATFFVLGWVADRHPSLIREIASAGHEIACHSYWHRLIYDLTPDQFREDTQRAIDAIGSACGIRPFAYRAPSYSVTARSMWALDILKECGFTHDSSIYPIEHDRYGIPGFSRFPSVIETSVGPILEVPVASVMLKHGHVVPVGGGGYLRLLPYRYTAAGLRKINREDAQPACVYFHPWEFDADQPRLAQGLVARLRTYRGLTTMEGKLSRLLNDFRFAPLGEVFPLPEAMSA